MILMPKEKTSYRILIVDDDAFLLDMYSLKFSQKGFQVTTSPGTLDALDKLRGGYVPDILLIDIVGGLKKRCHRRTSRE